MCSTSGKTHPALVPTLGLSGAIPLVPPCATWDIVWRRLLLLAGKPLLEAGRFQILINALLLI